jgi:hypothetical protein
MPSVADIHGINKMQKLKEISCQRIQSQVYLNYVECSRNSLSKNSLEFIAHVILEKQAKNVPKGTKKKLQENYR